MPPPTAKQIREAISEEKTREANGKSSPQPEPKPDEPKGIKYSLRATVIVTPDTDPRELEDLIRAGQVHGVLKNRRNKTLAVVLVEAVESLERLPVKNGDSP